MESPIDRGGRESGFTLPELLIATVLALILIGGAVTAFTASIGSQPRIQSKAAAIQQARTAMERMIRELRQGSTVLSASPSHIAIVTYANSDSCSPAGRACQRRVDYVCTAGTCTRTEANPDGTSAGIAVQTITGISNDNVFAYTAPTETAPASVQVTFSLPAQGGANAIVLSDAATLRNPGVS